MSLERISVTPEVMNGQPCIRGTRLTVKRLLRILAQYSDRSEMLKDYPRLDDAGSVKLSFTRQRLSKVGRKRFRTEQ